MAIQPPLKPYELKLKHYELMVYANGEEEIPLGFLKHHSTSTQALVHDKDLCDRVRAEAEKNNLSFHQIKRFAYIEQQRLEHPKPRLGYRNHSPNHREPLKFALRNLGYLREI